MENRARSGAGNSKQVVGNDFLRRGSSSATAPKATTASSTASHQRKLSSTSTRTVISGPAVTTRITRPRAATTKSAKELPLPPPTPSRHRRLSSASVASTSAPPATTNNNSRITQRTGNHHHHHHAPPPPPPSLNRSNTAPVPSRHEVVTAVHTDKESNTRNAKATVVTSPSASGRISSAPPTKPLKASNLVSAHRLPTTTTPGFPTVTTSANSSINPTTLNTHSTHSPTPADRNRDHSSLSASRPGSSHASTRTSPTPPKKHAPARFSSNGVETSGGPPPSLAYRRRFSMDNRGTPSVPSTPNNRPSYTRDQGGDSSVSGATISALPISTSGIAHGQTNPRRHSVKTMQRRQSYSSYDGEEDEEDDEYGERDRTIRGLEDLQNSSGASAKTNNDQCNEDVFLKLARTGSSSASRTADRLERRRARLSQHSQYRNSLPVETQSSPITPASIFNSSPPEVREDVWRRNAHMSSPANYRARRMSQASEERTSVTPRASFGARPHSLLRRENSPGHSRSFSMVDSSPPTALTNRAPTRGLSASPHIEENTRPDHDFAASVASGGDGGRSADSASTVSTTAASSVWDELDDLKSRIRRLEVTGHIPASSRAGGASNSSGDRPRTATTTVTTVSSSPRHNANGISPVNSTFANATTSHPLLHTALTKSRVVMPPDVYKHLELAAKDALDLANTVGAPGAAAPTNVNSDRTVRRKADSVCRSLTELCLALSENRHNITPAHHPFIQAQFAGSRPASRAVGADNSFGRDRESAAGRESALGDRLPSRTISRFSERKNSLASLSVAAGFSPRSDPITSPNVSGTIRHRSSMGLKEGFAERFRAPSRAATEVNLTPRLPNPHSRLSHPISREYTTPDTSSTLAPRRSTIVPTATHSSPLVSSPGKRVFSANLNDPSRRSQEFTMTGGPINDRLVSVANAEPNMSARFSTGSIGRSGNRRGLRGLRESVDLDSGRLTALKRAEAATERLLRR